MRKDDTVCLRHTLDAARQAVVEPFATLLVRAKSGVVIDEASVFAAAEELNP